MTTQKFTILDDDDSTPITLSDGTVLDENTSEAYAAERLASARRRGLIPGRKSLSGGTRHSPVVQIRLPETVRDELAQRAAEAGVPVSRLARELLTQALHAA